MAKQAIVIANHKNKTATLSFIDEVNNLVAVDYKNQPMIKLDFPYTNLTDYDFLFHSLEMIDNETEKFLFKIL